MPDKLTLDFFADYYSLQAMLVHRRRNEFPELISQAGTLLARICRPIADCLSDYMYLIGMGEARHAVGSDKLWYWKDIPTADGRVGAYRFAVKYDPLKTLPQLIELFKQTLWPSNYGGARWANICDIALKYRTGTLSPAVFIDFVADLKHNGGTQFNKTEVYGVMNFLPKFSTGNLSNFLTFKRDTDDYFAGISTHYIASLSLPVGRLVNQFMSRLGLSVPLWKSRAPIEYAPFQFGDLELTNKVDTRLPSYSSSASSSGKSTPTKISDLEYLSEDEMYDPEEASHDPKVSSGGGTVQPVVESASAATDGQPEPEEVKVKEEKGEAHDSGDDSFAQWLHLHTGKSVP